MSSQQAASESPLDGKTKPASSGIRTFLTKHAQLVTFVGALIVFATFIFREEVREEMKDLGSSIDAAQAVFETRRDTSALAEQLNVVGIIAINIAGSVMKGRTPEEREGQVLFTLRLRAFAVKTYAGSLEESIDNASRLLGKLDAEAGQAKTASELKTRTVELQKRCDDAADHLRPWAVDPKHLRTERELDTLFANQLVPLISDSYTLSGDIQKLAQDVLKRAQQAKERLERRYRWINWLSIGLFTGGWGLGLVAKLYGVDGVGA